MARDPDSRADADGLESRPIEALRAAAVARRYFLEGRTKSQIADEFSISRFKVARLIDWARQVGIARVEVTTPASLDADLGLRLERKFGLEAAMVLAGGPVPGPAVPAQIGPAAAAAIAEILQSDDVLGLGWGRTIDAAASALPALPACPVVQLIGVTSSAVITVNSSDIVRRVAAKTGGQAFQLHAPFFVADPALADALRREPLIASTVAMFPQVTKALLGVGSWDPAESGYISSLPRADREYFRQLDIAADFCAQLLDVDGAPVDPGLEPRTIAMTAAELRKVPTVVAAAGGQAKARAILAVLRSGLAAMLVTDATAAAEVLALADRASSS
ncbi:MAG TPA: sugar-binding domain-containing protein [Streptosporangiaceae bacterium]